MIKRIFRSLCAAITTETDVPVPPRINLRADAIEQVVTLELRRLSKCLCDNEEDFATLLADKTNADIFKEKKHLESELQKCLMRSEQVSGLCIKCYEENVAGKLSDEMFMRFSQKYEAERLELKEKISAYRKRLSGP